VADVQVAVGLWRESRAHDGMPARRQVLADDLPDEVVLFRQAGLSGMGRGGHAVDGVGASP
jgi:hypothetical protein